MHLGLSHLQMLLQMRQVLGGKRFQVRILTALGVTLEQIHRALCASTWLSSYSLSKSRPARLLACPACRELIGFDLEHVADRRLTKSAVVGLTPSAEFTPARSCTD
jgi:hypothetical protein